MVGFARVALIKYIIAALCWSKALFSSIKISRDVGWVKEERNSAFETIGTGTR